MMTEETLNIQKMTALIDEMSSYTAAVPHVIYENAHLTVPGEPRRRGWKERFLSWPFRPWVSHMPTRKPDPAIYQTPQGIFAHPATARRIRESLHNP